MSVQTQQFVIRLFALTVAAIACAITAVLLVRVAIDGNLPLTQQITQGFLNDLPTFFELFGAVILGGPLVNAAVAKIAASLSNVQMVEQATDSPPAVLGTRFTATAANTATTATPTTPGGQPS